MRANSVSATTILVLALCACGAGSSDTGAADGTGSEAASAAASTTDAAADTVERDGPLFSPGGEAMTARAPDVYRAVLHTSEGTATVEVRRAWAPRGADRFYNLARHGFFEDARFFRVIEGFVAQFGLSGRPELDRLWRRHPIRDDPVRRANERGTLTFAAAGEDTRTTQLFVNLADNTRLDTMGFAPVGRVVEGMAVFDSLHGGYGDGPPRGEGPSQATILERGNAYLQSEFPKLDHIDSVQVREGPADGG